MTTYCPDYVEDLQRHAQLLAFRLEEATLALEGSAVANDPNVAKTCNASNEVLKKYHRFESDNSGD